MISTIRIDGMRTVHCVRAVFTALAAVPGITSAEVEIGRAVVDHDERASPQLLAAAVGEAGYGVRAVVREGRRLGVLRVDDASGGTA